jgi:hypothetical protein
MQAPISKSEIESSASTQDDHLQTKLPELLLLVYYEANPCNTHSSTQDISPTPFQKN